MATGYAVFKSLFLGSSYSGFTIDFYVAGTTTPKNVWTDADKTTAVNQITADSTGMATWYADGVYKMVIKDSNGTTLWTWDNVVQTADTGTLWEDNYGTSYPSATSSTKGQMFALFDASDNLIEVGVSNGSSFTNIAPAIVSASKYDSLNEAISDIGGTSCDLLITSQIPMTADATVPSTMRLVFAYGGSIDQDNYTLTINGGIKAGLYKIFYNAADDGTVIYTTLHYCYPHWWGINGDGSTDDSKSIAKAIQIAGGNPTHQATNTFYGEGVVYLPYTGNGYFWNLEESGFDAQIDRHPRVKLMLGDFIKFYKSAGFSNGHKYEYLYPGLYITGNLATQTSGTGARVALGSNCIADTGGDSPSNSGVALGWKSMSIGGGGATAFGDHCVASDTDSIAIGNYCVAGKYYYQNILGSGVTISSALGSSATMVINETYTELLYMSGSNDTWGGSNRVSTTDDYYNNSGGTINCVIEFWKADRSDMEWTDILDYDGTTKTITFDATGLANTYSCTNGDFFVIKESTSNGHAICIGDNSFCTSGNSVALGSDHVLLSKAQSAQYNVALGRAHTISQRSYGTAIGYGAEISIANGQFTHSCGYFSNRGDAQVSRFVLKVTTTDASATALEAEGVTALPVPTDTTWGFVAHVVGRRTDADDESAFYRVEGCVDNNGGTTALVGSVTITTIAEDNAAWNATAGATSGGLRIYAQGEASKTINWVANVTLVQVTG